MEQEFNEAICGDVMERGAELEGALGAVAFAVLEMFRRGGMPEAEVEALHGQMKEYFARPSNEECNAIVRMVERRLESDKIAGTRRWYS